MDDTVKSSGMATTSLVLGILGIFFGWITLGILPLAAVILGHKSRASIKRANGRLLGDGRALGGLITGYIALSISIVTVLSMYSAYTSYQQYIARAAVSDAINMAATYKTALASKILEKKEGAALDTNPASIGIDQRMMFISRYVGKISYDTDGVITIVLAEDPRLKKSSGKRIVLRPEVQSNTVRWRLDRSRTTVETGHLPRAMR